MLLLLHLHRKSATRSLLQTGKAVAKFVRTPNAFYGASLLRRLTPLRAADFNERISARDGARSRFCSCGFLNFGHDRRADYGRVSDAPENRYVCRQRNAEPDRDGQRRKFSRAANQRRAILAAMLLVLQ